jgi:alpha-L-rhamnosidase
MFDNVGTIVIEHPYEVRVERLRAERRDEALGVGVESPRLSWLTVTDAPGWAQAAYEVEIVDPATGRVTSSGRVDSGDSVLVPWPDAPLGSRQRRQVQVRVWGADGTASGWSEPLAVEAGLLRPSDWTARFVAPITSSRQQADPRPGSLLRREVTLAGPSPVERARLYVTALGVYEVEINGQRVGDHVLAPGWTSYDHRLRYETFDVTDLVRPGANAIGAWLAEGWYGGKLGWEGRHAYGDGPLALLAQLEVTRADGTVEVVATDASWRSAPGPIVASGIYAGETYDARLERPGWSSPGSDGDDGEDEHGWTGVSLVERDLATIVARTSPPVRRIELVPPVGITTSPSGRTIVDFGQNLVGRLRITVSGPAGTTVTLRHAEVLQDGELCTGPLRLAQATDRYTLRGDPTGAAETWEPRFTFHGFRYAEVDGWPGELRPDEITAVVCHSDMERTGWFACSDDRVTRLHENVVWGMRGNFLDVPTDCPQRDERLGWTGDINVFAPTASFLYDCDGFLADWLADLAADQRPDGEVPLVVPDAIGEGFPAAVWGDAAVVVPWVLYERFGDAGVLRDQYASMRAWVDLVVGLAGERRLWDRGFQFADWLDPAAPEDRPHEGRTEPHLVATAALCHSLDVLAAAGDVIGEADGAARDREIATEVRKAFAAEYVAPSGLLVSDSQTAYALALRYALLPDEDQRRRAGQRLAKLARRAGYRIATGFVGTPIVCDALCDAGEADSAYELLLQEDCPSWLYPVLQGATTVWERWDGIRPDGSLNGTRMNSFNHYALGAVADWLHRTVGGLAPAAPGYRRLRIAPVPGGGLTWAEARHLTPYGTAESSWRIEGEDLVVTAVVPPNTTATVVLPSASGTGTEPVQVAAGRHEWRVRQSVSSS